MWRLGRTLGRCQDHTEQKIVEGIRKPVEECWRSAAPKSARSFRSPGELGKKANGPSASESQWGGTQQSAVLVSFPK